MTCVYRYNYYLLLLYRFVGVFGQIINKIDFTRKKIICCAYFNVSINQNIIQPLISTFQYYNY